MGGLTGKQRATQARYLGLHTGLFKSGMRIFRHNNGAGNQSKRLPLILLFRPDLGSMSNANI